MARTLRIKIEQRIKELLTLSKHIESDMEDLQGEYNQTQGQIFVLKDLLKFKHKAKRKSRRKR